jgi:hypothetical protein
VGGSFASTATAPVLGWAAMPNFTTVASAAPGGFPTAPGGGAFFAAGPNVASSQAIQDVNVSGHQAEIDAGRATAILGGQLGGFGNQDDAPSLSANFLDADYHSLGSTAIPPLTASDRAGATGFRARQSSGLLPAGTRTVQVIASGQRSFPDYNDAYFDDLSLNLAIAPLPGGAGGTNNPATNAAISGFTFSNTSFAAENRGPSATNARKKKRPPRGTKVSFRLNEAATVGFTVTQRAKGRKIKRGKKTVCVKPTKKNRKRGRCTRVVTLTGSFSRNGVAGKNSFHFTGRLNGRKLKLGRYRLVATPSAGGNKGKPISTGFRIVR